MALAVDLALRQQVVVVLVGGGIGPEGGELLVGLLGLALREIGVGQADGDDFRRRSRLFGLLEVVRGQIEVVHREQKVGGLDQIVGRDRRRFSDAAFGEAQADLLLRVVVLTVAHHQARDRQPSFHAIRIGRFQGAREAIHRRLSVAQRQQRVAGVEQDCRLVAARAFGGLHVAQRLVPAAQVRVGVRHAAVDQRIVRREASAAFSASIDC